MPINYRQKGPQRVLFIPNDLSPGGETSYLEDLSGGLFLKGIESGCVVVNNRGSRYEELQQMFTLCRDLSDLPAGPRKIYELARTIGFFRPTHILCWARIFNYTLPLLDPEISPIAVLHSDNENFYRRAARFPERLFAWVCPTPRVAEGMKKWLTAAHQQKVWTIPHGISHERFDGIALPIEDRKTDLLFVGALYKHKGAHLLPAIVAKMSDCMALASLKMAIIGDGVLRENLISDFEVMGLQTDFLGQQTRQCVAKIMGSSKVLLFPTMNEGFGLVLVEAMMAGTVPVTSCLEGITDNIIHDGENGFLLSPNDVAGFADRVSRLLTDHNLWKRMSRNAMETARKKFAMDVVVSHYEDLFSQPDKRDPVHRRRWAGWLYEVAKQELNEAASTGNFFSHLSAVIGFRRLD